MSEQIDKLVKERRNSDDASRKWGLALSGGGIRSATFCFGLLSALSRNRLLHQFDLLSTVSGGGYIGAMIGRLLARAKNPEEVRSVLDAFGARETRWFTWWLRANGRYLIPRGTADRMFAMTIFIRNLIAVHLELGAIAILLGVGLAGFDLALWSELDRVIDGPLFSSLRWLSEWLPTPWLLLLPIILLASFLAVAYWVVPWAASGGWIWGYWWLLLVFWYVLFSIREPFEALQELAGAQGASVRTFLLWALLSLSGAWLVAIPLSRYLLKKVQRKSGDLRVHEEAVRRCLTDGLVRLFKATGVVILAGLVDRVAWFLAFEYRNIANTGMLLALAAIVLRALLPEAAGLKPGSGGTRGLLILGRVMGYVLTFGLCAWWVSVVHLAALGSLFGRNETVEFENAVAVLLGIGLPVVLYLIATGWNCEFLNLSSLHPFYQARLVRSYLGAANSARFGKASSLDAIEVVPDTLPTEVRQKSIFDLDPDDDVAMTEYTPHRFHGLVHLINVCINQTRDPHGGLFNQDRRGQLLTIAPGGLMRVGQNQWQKMNGRGGLSLGSWVAISGAAVSPGLGQGTRGGLAALVTFAGLRLGYWWSQSVRKSLPNSEWRLAAKSLGLLREIFGRFGGDEAKDWFLTDGGHFENTAAYTLLAEQAEVIVVADCGADPDYAFGDLENLVRKARIDLGTEIRFLKPRRNAPISAPIRAFGSLDDLASKKSEACLALAKVDYGNDTHALMIVVKPNMCPSLPVDLINFAAVNPDFPQQTTADQFFDEAQWESYYRLGNSLGNLIDSKLITLLQSHLDELFEADSCFMTNGKEDSDDRNAATGALTFRMPARIRENVVTASISVVGLMSIGLPVWHELGKVFGPEEVQLRAENEMLKELGVMWSKLPPPHVCEPEEATAKAVAEIGMLAEELIRNVDFSCATKYSDRYLTEINNFYDDAVEQCEQLSIRMRPPSCIRLLELSSILDFQKQDATLWSDCPSSRLAENNYSHPHYWAYLYTHSSNPLVVAAEQRHPLDPLMDLKTIPSRNERRDLDKDPCPTNLETTKPVEQIFNEINVRLP